MCEECDLFNARGEGKYTKKGRQTCMTCAFTFFNILIVVGMVFISLLLTVRAVQSNVNFIKAKVIC